MKDVDVIDLFNEELNRKNKKLSRKVEKARIKEEKKKARDKKKLEKLEDIKFEEYLKRLREENIIEMPDKSSPKTIKPTNKIENDLFIEKQERHPFLNFLIGVFSIILLVISVDYVVYNAYTNYTDLPTLINSVLLAAMTFFYLLSMAVNKQGLKKSLQILSLLSIIAFMSYHLFIA